MDWIAQVEAMCELNGRFAVLDQGSLSAADPRRLSRGEAQVAQLLALGLSQKQIAYTLGLSPSSVSRRVHRGAGKLLLGSPAELVAVFASVAREVTLRGLRPARRELKARAHAAAAVDGHGALSPAEQAVAGLATLGCSDTEIARQRGASARTVGNQLGAIYRKLGIHSRTELAARMSA